MTATFFPANLPIVVSSCPLSYALLICQKPNIPLIDLGHLQVNTGVRGSIWRHRKGENTVRTVQCHWKSFNCQPLAIIALPPLAECRILWKQRYRGADDLPVFQSHILRCVLRGQLICFASALLSILASIVALLQEAGMIAFMIRFIPPGNNHGKRFPCSALSPFGYATALAFIGFHGAWCP